MSTTPQTSAAQRISDFQKLVNQHQDKIRRAGNDAWAGIRKGSEVDRVHDFLSSKTAGNSLLNREVASLFKGSGWVVKFAGIFLHQKPYVRGYLRDGKIPLPKNCELGDLQTLFVYVRADKTEMKVRSVIFQAKLKPAKGNFDVSHEIQRQLYDCSPQFEYQTVLKGKRRLPTGLNRERALQYLFVNESPVSVKTIPAAKGQGAFAEYGEHLLRFLNDSTGLNVDTVNRRDQWSRIVNDMISEFKTAVPGERYKRQSGLKGILNPFNSFESQDVVFLQTPEAAENKGEGFGLQLVIVWDGELGEDASTTSVSPLDQLRALADYYDTSHYKETEFRIQRKDDLVAQMAQLIRTERIDLKLVLDDALESKSQGLAAAMAEMLCKISDPKWTDGLIQLLPIIKWKHAVKVVLRAILACEPRGVTTEQSALVLQSVEARLTEDPQIKELVDQIESLASERVWSERVASQPVPQLNIEM
jgi:hypothetical protein